MELYSLTLSKTKTQYYAFLNCPPAPPFLKNLANVFLFPLALKISLCSLVIVLTWLENLPWYSPPPTGHFLFIGYSEQNHSFIKNLLNEPLVQLGIVLCTRETALHNTNKNDHFLEVLIYRDYIIVYNTKYHMTELWLPPNFLTSGTETPDGKMLVFTKISAWEKLRSVLGLCVIDLDTNTIYTYMCVYISISCKRGKINQWEFKLYHKSDICAIERSLDSRSNS